MRSGQNSQANLPRPFEQERLSIFEADIDAQAGRG